jgi:hypothetical protein
MLTVLAIDPGSSESAFVILKPNGRIADFAKLPNPKILLHLQRRELHADLMAIEKIASYGMPVGAETFDTCFWSGRFIEAWGGSFTSHPWRLIPRAEVKMHLCHKTAGVNDSVIRQRLIDLHGGKEAAIGRKAMPGPLYGVKADCWQALALAVTAAEIEAAVGMVTA